MASSKMKNRFLGGEKIAPPAIKKDMKVADLIDLTFNAYNGARIKEAARLLTEKMLNPNVTVGMSLTGALTPAGLGMSSLIPLIEAGFVDWVISTGANLYHDTHFAIGKDLHKGTHQIDDRVLFEEGVVRIYDVFFDYDVLLDTDLFFREVIEQEEFQRPMSTAEFHWLCGKYISAREKALGLGKKSFLAACYRADVPVYTSSPGDSSIGMNVAAKALDGNKLMFDTNADVNETAAIVLDAKRKKGKSACWILGGGSPKNFLLQTEPQIQEVLGILEQGHDYFLQVTDARPDTGGLSGATPAEAVSWGKVDPSKLPDSVVAYVDSTVALPLLTAYAVTRHEKRPLRRLYQRREEVLGYLKSQYKKSKKTDGKPDRPVERRKAAMGAKRKKPNK